MPRVIITEGAAIGLEHCRQFLLRRNPQATKRAGQAIERQFALLESNPDLGRPLDDHPELRELIISFGDSGYVALYRYVPIENIVYVLSFRHQKKSWLLIINEVCRINYKPPPIRHPHRI